MMWVEFHDETEGSGRKLSAMVVESDKPGLIRLDVMDGDDKVSTVFVYGPELILGLEAIGHAESLLDKD